MRKFSTPIYIKFLIGAVVRRAGSSAVRHVRKLRETRGRCYSGKNFYFCTILNRNFLCPNVINVECFILSVLVALCTVFMLLSAVALVVGLCWPFTRPPQRVHDFRACCPHLFFIPPFCGSGSSAASTPTGAELCHRAEPQYGNPYIPALYCIRSISGWFPSARFCKVPFFGQLLVLHGTSA